ncbi:MAG TPA: adenosylmethionine--8-amino-7-oxononanoate transaminase [Alphaproteobacteria bacterium]|nr:adenosylmethionine--8-amino-7-oxononanoate transaminase [Alphaproteobacteria bacterium]
MRGLDRLWRPYTQMKTAESPLAVRATNGTRIVLEGGRELIDGIASWWTAVHGYNHPAIVEAIKRQTGIMPHVMLGGLVHEPALTLASRLSDLVPGGPWKTFFSESGSVAVEVALKIAAQHWINKGETERRRFVGFRGGYHGDTFATMAVGDTDEGMHRLFKGLLAEQIIVELPNTMDRRRTLDRLLATRRHEIAAVIVEPLVQGAGGMRFHDIETLAAIAGTCRRHGVLLIADEIFVGLGRLGTMFACEQAEVVPDIVCLGKALTGGALPLAATLARESVYAPFHSDSPDAALMHGPTFMGNPLACAAANASLDLFATEPRLDQVRAMERWLGEGLEPARDLPGVADVRARGAIGVVQLESREGLETIARRCLELGLWVRPFLDIVYLTPAYTMPEREVAALCSGVVSALKAR